MGRQQDEGALWRFPGLARRHCRCQPRGEVYYHDEKQQGLTCCGTEAGSKTCYRYRWVQGRPERVRIAKVGELSVEQARDEAKRMIGEIATG